MVLDLEIEVITKKVAVPAGHLTRHIHAATQDGLRDLTAQAGGRHNQAFAVLLQQVFIDASARKDAATTHAAQMADAGEFDEVAVANVVFGQHHQVIAALFLGLGVIDAAVDDIHLVANDRLDACL